MGKRDSAGRAFPWTLVPTLSRGEKAGIIPHTLTQALGEELSQGTGALLAGFQEGGELSFSIC